MASKEVRNIIHRFKTALSRSDFPKFSVLVFGSYARGEEGPDSDIDLCLVSSSFKNSKEKYRKEAVFVAFQVDPRIQLVLASPTDIKKNSLSQLFSNIYKESTAA